MAIRRDVFERLDGFDEAYQVGYGDIDICLRAVDAGYRVVYTPFTRLIHHEGGSRGFSQPASDVLRATVKMYSRITAGDPFFNPSLSYNFRLPQIASPKESSRKSILLKILSDYNLIDFTNLDTHNPERWQFRISNLDKSTDISGRKPRILFVSHDLNRSGAPLILMKLCEYLNKHGYEGMVLSPLDGPLHAEYSEMGIAVTILDSVLDDARTILDHLNEHDLLFANTILAYRTIHAARAFQIPVLWWIHESNYGQNIARSNPGASQAFNTADAVIFPSVTSSSLYKDFSSQDNYYPIHIGIDIEPPAKQSSDHFTKPKDSTFRIVQITSIEPRKGQDILLQSLQLMPKAVTQNIEFDLIGRLMYQTDERYYLGVVKTSKKLGNVNMIGKIPAEEIRHYLESADVLVLPSRDEALPQSLIEAMAYGKAVIASRVGGIPEIIQDGYNGLLIDREDYKGLSQKLLALYRNPELIQKLGQNAQATYMTELTMDRFGGKIVELIEMVSRKHA
jgi:glycosyltransferase involved in cell wall biosynthesis